MFAFGDDYVAFECNLSKLSCMLDVIVALSLNLSDERVGLLFVFRASVD